MDKNIAALIREDAKTVGVSFSSGGKVYTYVTNLDFALGDFVVVSVYRASEAFENTLQVVCIVEVHNELRIEPNSDIKYKWIMAKLDTSVALENEAKNAEIEALLQNAYVSNIRKQFRQQMLENVDVTTVERLSAVLNK